MVYILGGAGVGKSTWVQQSQLSRTHQMIDPDRIVGLCPIDDANPGGVDSPTHRWCKQQCNELLEEALKSPRRQSFVLVGTGKSFGNKAPNKHPKVQLMRRATQMGFRTRVIFLHCPVDVARERNASRPRSLPDELVVSTMESSRRLYELLRAVCDVAEERDTSAHESFRRGRKASLADVDHQMVAWLKDLAHHARGRRRSSASSIASIDLARQSSAGALALAAKHISTRATSADAADEDDDDDDEEEEEDAPRSP